MISNQTRAARSFDFEITRMISDQIVLHSVQISSLTWEKVERNWLYFPLRKRARYIGRHFYCLFKQDANQRVRILIVIGSYFKTVFRIKIQQNFAVSRRSILYGARGCA